MGVRNRDLGRWSMRRAAAAIGIVASIALLPGCGDDDDSTTTAAQEPAPGEGAPAPDAGEPTVDGRFAAGESGTKLAIRCWGEGSPTVVFEAGHPASGLADYEAEPGFRQVVADVSAETTACVYDRAGEGESVPLSKERRTVDDLANDLHDLLGAADVSAPYVLVGSSFGGFPAAHYAGRYPDEVAGLVLLDVPAPVPNLNVPEAEWDHPSNPEFVDAPATERLLATDRLPIEAIPVRVVTASGGDSSKKNQAFWLDLSPKAEQVVVEGGHDIHFDNPDAVSEQILDVAG